MAISLESCVAVLLGRNDAARHQLRQALEERGAAIALEGDLVGASADEVLRIQPNVVIVTLETGDDDDALDALQAVFDDPDINVVFNDADASRTLEGWDLARWARHLVAKVLGHEDTMPPPPPGAARLQVNPVVDVAAREFESEPEPEFAAVVEVEPELDPEPDLVEPEPEPDLSLEAALGLTSEPVSVAPPETAAVEELAPVADLTVPEVAEIDLQLDDFSLEDALNAEDVVTPERLSSVPELVETADIEADVLDIPEAQELLDADLPVVEAIDESELTVTLDESIEDFDWGDELSTADVETSKQAQDDGVEAVVTWSLPDVVDVDADADATDVLDADVAALAAQLEAFEAEETEEAVADLEFSPADAIHEVTPEPDAIETTVETSEDAAKDSVLSDLSLAPLDASEANEATDAATKPEFDFSGLADLSLEPIEEEKAEDAEEADPLLVAMGLAEGISLEQFNQMEAVAAPSTAAIDHVLVLGASIGGPDALRSFLSELPVDLRAVILVVQHLESGYFERLGQQLQKSTRLAVKLAAANTVAAQGQVLVIPANARVILETDGRLLFTPHTEPPRYTPSIDDVLHDVADRFGKHATAIIFSGMAGDAVEGAVYLTGKGGEVWAQDPQSCVVSSMVDGAQARGIVEFSGSPRELAARCVAKLMR